MSVVHNHTAMKPFPQATWGWRGLMRRVRSGVRGVDIFALFPLALLWIVFLGIVPIVVAIILGMIQGTSVNGAREPAPGYPALPMLSTGLIVPALLLAVLFFRTFTWPLKSHDTVHRYEIAGMCFVGLATALQSTSLDERFLPTWAAYLNGFTMALFGATILLAFVRSVAGMMRLVPRSWREEPSKPTRKRRS